MKLKTITSVQLEIWTVLQDSLLAPDHTNTQSNPHSKVPTLVPDLTNAQSNPHNNVPISSH